MVCFSQDISDVSFFLDTPMHDVPVYLTIFFVRLLFDLSENQVNWFPRPSTIVTSPMTRSPMVPSLAAALLKQPKPRDEQPKRDKIFRLET